MPITSVSRLLRFAAALMLMLTRGEGGTLHELDPTLQLQQQAG